MRLATSMAKAIKQGFVAREHRLITRTMNGLCVRVLPDGQPALVLRHPTSGTVIRLAPERQFSDAGNCRSVSFVQRPDITIEIERQMGPTELIVLDPKYKLDSELMVAASDGMPKKEDIDKMHAYRDAIRDSGGKRVVTLAAILYPGRHVEFGNDVAAISAIPGAKQPFRKFLERTFSRALETTY